jgi:alpha-N-arabinofuranosidase
MDSVNTFASPQTVAPKPVSVTASSGRIALQLAPHSVTVVALE